MPAAGVPGGVAKSDFFFSFAFSYLEKILAERTGLEPATPGVTGRYSNQLNYRSFCYGPRLAERLGDAHVLFLVGAVGVEPTTFAL